MKTSKEKAWVVKSQPKATIDQTELKILSVLADRMQMDSIAKEEIQDVVDRANLNLNKMGWELTWTFDEEDTEIYIFLSPKNSDS